MDAPSTPPPIDGYQILELLGAGGMGSVYRARQLALDREVALKLLHPDLEQRDAVARFLREARVMATARHPHLIELLDSGSTPAGTPWIAMRLVDGISLEEKLKDAGPLSPEEARAVMLQVAGALEALHRLEVIHRDLKPANILVEPSGRAVLMDLGVARTTRGSDLTASGVILGTPFYTPPEVLRGEPPEARDDWYAWGLTWWQLRSGRALLSLRELLGLAASGESPRIPGLGRLGLSEGEKAVLRAVTGPRSQRPTSLSEILELMRAPPPAAEPLSTFLIPVVQPEAPPGDVTGAVLPVPPPSVPDPRRRPVAAALVISGLLALAVGLALRPRDPAPAPTPTREPPRITLRYRDLASALFRIEGAADLGLHAARTDRDAVEPVAVLDLEQRGAWVWLAGLAPDEAGEVTFEATGWRASLPFGPAGPDLPDPDLEVPWLLRPYLVRLADAATRARARDYLEWLGTVCPEEGRRLDEADLMIGMARGARIPELAWPRILARLAAGGGQADNLLRAFRLWEVQSPEPVSWQLLHLLAGWSTRRWLEGAWAAQERAAGIALRGRGPPATLSELLPEWLMREPRTARGVHAIALWLARQPDDVPAFGYRVPGWTRWAPGAIPSASPPTPLDRLLLRARSHQRIPPEQLASLPEVERLFGLALLGVDPAGLRHAPWILETIRTGSVAEARAADAALEGLHFSAGALWQCGREGTLWFWGVGDQALRDLAVQPAGTAVHRRELGRVWAFLPGGEGAVSWTFDRDSRGFREPIRCP